MSSSDSDKLFDNWMTKTKQLLETCALQCTLGQAPPSRFKQLLEGLLNAEKRKHASDLDIDKIVYLTRSLIWLDNNGLSCPICFSDLKYMEDMVKKNKKLHKRYHKTQSDKNKVVDDSEIITFMQYKIQSKNPSSKCIHHTCLKCISGLKENLEYTEDGYPFIRCPICREEFHVGEYIIKPGFITESDSD